ncbi:MAG: VCBS repeat-containing protein [Nocardioidaceae bacterium]
MTAGLIDRDGNTDIVAGLDNDSTASALLRGKGDGHFRQATHWIVGTNGLEVGDLDADGRDDLVSFVDDRLYGTLSTRRGFESAKLTPGPLSEDLVDLDGDGDLDKVTGATGLISGKLKSVIIAQLGTGDGTFGKQITSNVRGETAASGIGDINEDGIPDVVGGFDNFQASPNNLFWSIGRGDGSFGKATLSVTGDFHADILGVGLADVNGDTHLDIVTHNLTQLTVKLGVGDGTFGAPIASGVGGPGQREVLLADVTGDGDIDAVTIVRTGSEDFGSGEIRQQQGHGDGTFTLVQTVSVQSNLNNGTLADLNNDTRPDVVTAGTRGSNGGINAMYVLLTTAGGQLGAPTTYAGPVGQVRTADLDLNGDPDIATTGSSKIDFYLNNGNGVFPVIDDTLAGGGLGTLGDLDGDGDPDMLSGTPLGDFAVHINAKA